ncbi:Hint domain-containing protein [Acidisoma sp.]|uniref:Hint domain-containing protein n=1 Tax=Acidisoma sp. TaxID=1872115 RepID=UPI003AFFA746
MSDYILISGQTVSGIVVSAGTYLEIGSGGTAINTLVKDGGYETVFSGGITTSTTIRAGGSEEVSSGGTAIGTAVKDGGYLQLGPGGVASSAAVSGGGTMIVSAGGVAFDTQSAAAAVLSITNLVTSGQTVSGVTVGSSSLLDVGSGGRAVSTTVVNGGSEIVSSGGTVSGTVVSSGAVLRVLNGGSAAGTTVLSGGTFIVISGGSSTGTVVSSGGLGSVQVVVSSGQVSSGLVANSVTSVYVLAGGVTSGTMLMSGGTEVVSAQGRDVGTVVSAGGYDLISGLSVGAVVSGGALIQGGTTDGLTITGNGSVIAEDAVLGFSVLSNTTITGNGTLTVSDGGDVSGSVVFGGSGTFVISSTAMPFATLSGFTASDKIDLAGVVFGSGGSANYSDGSLVVTEGGQNYVLQFGDTAGGTAFAVAADPFGGTLLTVSPPPCFAAGTLIATPDGDVAVEKLAVGDPVMTEGGGTALISWIGSRRIDVTRHPDPAQVWPVRIRAHAFAPSRPARDLFLSPDHAIFAEGVLIPVKHLVNGGSIAQVPAAEVTYFHVELPEHSVVLAEGLPVESYLDTGDRNSFAGGEGVQALHPAFGSERADISLVMEALGYAPLRVAGLEVERTRAALAARVHAAADAMPPAAAKSCDKRRQRRAS